MNTILDVRPVGVARYTSLPVRQRDYHAAFHVDLSDGTTLSIDIGISSTHATLFANDDEQRMAVYRLARSVAEDALAAGTLAEGVTLELSEPQARAARQALDAESRQPTPR